MKTVPTPMNAVAILLLGLAGSAGFAAQETNRPPARTELRTDYSTFKIVADRNIFNANRSRGFSGPPRELPKPKRVDAFALVGTMEYEKGPVAFFDGSSSEYRKALKPDGTIAGYKLTAINSKSVKLEAGDKKTDLTMGMQLRREDEGEWQLAAFAGDFGSSSGGGREFGRSDSGRESRDSGRRDYSSRDSRGRDYGSRDSGRSSSGGSSTPASTVSSADVNEALKRLMEQREKENK